MGRQMFRLTLASLLLIATAACDQSTQTSTSEAEGSGTVMATVNGVKLYESELQAIYDALPAEAKQLPFAFLRDQLVPVLINRELMANAAEAAGYADDEEVKRLIADARANIIRDAWMFDEIENRQTEERLRAVYETRMAEMAGDGDGSGVERQASHILVPSEEEAIDIIQQLDDGGDFVALANAHSIDKNAIDGDLGYFSRGMMVETFEEAAFGLDVGSYTAAPVQSDFGWHIIMVADEREQSPPTFEDVRAELAQGEVRAIYEEIIAELSEGGNVVMPEPAVEATELEPLAE